MSQLDAGRAAARRPASSGAASATGTRGKWLIPAALGTALLFLSIYPARFLAGGTLWPTLDGQAHAFRVLALERAIAGGVWYPRWLPDLLQGYGYPLFEFYAPLLYYLALPFRLLGASPLGALEAVTALGFVVAGLGAYALAREYLDPLGGLVAAAAYVYWPYRLAVVYVRGDVPEALALDLLPLVLWRFVRLAARRQADEGRIGRSVALAALALAAVICTHNVTALLFAPVVVAAVGVAALGVRSEPPGLQSRGWGLRQRLSTLLVPGLALAAGLGLAAFFWLPALWDTRWLHTERLYFGDYLGSLVSPLALLQPVSWAYHYYPDTGNPEITFPPGFMALALALPGAAALLRPGLARRQRAALLFALALLVLPLGGMLRAFAPVLAHVQVIQAPYRWLGLAGLGAALLTGAATLWLGKLPALPRAAAAGGLALLLAASATSRLAPPGAAVPANLSLSDLYAYEASHGAVGTTWAGEFTPRWTTGDPLRFTALAGGAPPDGDPALAVAAIGIDRWTAVDRRLRVESASEIDLALHAAYLPGWQASVDGQPAVVRPLGQLGLASVRVPQGRHEVRFHLGSTPVRLLATGLSALALVGLLALSMVSLPMLARAIPPRGPESRPAAGLGAPGRVGPASPSDHAFAEGERADVPPLPAPLPTGEAGRAEHSRVRVALLALAVPFILALAAVLSGAYAGRAPASAPARPVRVDLGGKVELLAASAGPSEPRPGEAISLTLYWLSLAPLPDDYKVFVHLVDAERRKVAQDDGLPVAGSGRTSAWWPGEVIEDQRVLRVPAGAPPGEYQLVVGLYHPGSGARLPARPLDIRLPAATPDGNSVLAGTVRVR